jgi:chloride channel 3/4/5
VTVKDCLKYQFKAEALENPRDEGGNSEVDAKVWDGLQKVGGWLHDAFGSLRRGRLRLSSPTNGRPNEHARSTAPVGSPEVELDDR